MYDKLTKKDIEKMEQEIEHRKLVIRKQAIEDVKEARAHGDLSENFECKAAKKFKNENESRIRYLELYIEDDDCEEECENGYYAQIRNIYKSDDESENISRF